MGTASQGGLLTSAIMAGVGCFTFGISASSAVARTAVSTAVWPLWASARTARCLVPI